VKNINDLPCDEAPFSGVWTTLGAASYLMQL
jgi:hypothetical protein